MTLTSPVMVGEPAGTIWIDMDNATSCNFDIIGTNTKMEKTKKLIIPIGIPGSGKTSDAPEDCIVLSKDGIRFMLLNYEKTGNDFNIELEYIVEEIEKDIFRKLTRDGYNIYIDECNVTEYERMQYIILAKRHNYKITYVVYEDLFEALERNSERDRVVPERVMTDFVNKFEYPTFKEIEIIDEVLKR